MPQFFMRGNKWLTLEQLKEYNRKRDEESKEPSESEEILDLRAKYKEKFGKDVANAYKNQVEWIQKKLAE